MSGAFSLFDGNRRAVVVFGCCSLAGILCSLSFHSSYAAPFCSIQNGRDVSSFQYVTHTQNYLQISHDMSSNIIIYLQIGENPHAVAFFYT